ncbi:hypothetical protein MTO96_013831 [Rhipicephalus appendiculatus]
MNTRGPRAVFSVPAAAGPGEGPLGPRQGPAAASPTRLSAFSRGSATEVFPGGKGVAQNKARSLGSGPSERSHGAAVGNAARTGSASTGLRPKSQGPDGAC